MFVDEPALGLGLTGLRANRFKANRVVTIQHMHRLETMEYLFQETP